MYSAEEFSRIFTRYWEKLYAICMRYVADASAAQDMVQGIFVSLWEKKGVLADEQSLERYLSKAAKYQVYKHGHKLKMTLQDPLDSSFDNIGDAAHNTPLQDYTYRETLEHFERQISLLKEPAKSIFLMSRQHALTHKEIATRMGIKVKTVEYHLTNALRFLRKQLHR